MQRTSLSQSYKTLCLAVGLEKHTKQAWQEYQLYTFAKSFNTIDFNSRKGWIDIPEHFKKQLIGLYNLYAYGNKWHLQGFQFADYFDIRTARVYSYSFIAELVKHIQKPDEFGLYSFENEFFEARGSISNVEDIRSIAESIMTSDNVSQLLHQLSLENYKLSAQQFIFVNQALKVSDMSLTILRYIDMYGVTFPSVSEKIRNGNVPLLARCLNI